MVVYRLVILAFLGISLAACAQKQSAPAKLAKTESIYRSGLPSQNLFFETKKFLQWSKGYNLSYSDPRRGLMVTDWMNEDSFQRHRLSLRINRDVKGSILTAHTNVQQYRGGRWVETQIMRGAEDAFIHELATHLKKTTKVRSGR